MFLDMRLTRQRLNRTLLLRQHLLERVTMSPEQMVRHHIESGAGVTVAGIRVPRSEAFAARMHNGRPAAQPNMTYMKVAPEAGALTIRELERHPHSNQSFVPMKL